MAGKRIPKHKVTIRTLWGIAKSPELQLGSEELHLVVQAQTGKDSEEANEEIYARTREKLTKRDYIEPDSIKTSITAPDRKGRRTLRVTYSPLDAEKEVNKDIRIDGAEVTIE